MFDKIPKYMASSLFFLRVKHVGDNFGRKKIIALSRLTLFVFYCRMWTRYVLIAYLAITKQVFGIEVYEPSEPNAPSQQQQQQQQQWKSQDSIEASADVGQDKYRPITFDAADAQESRQQPSLYNANIQSGASTVAGVLGQRSVRINSDF